MNAWDKQGLIKFKRDVIKGKKELDSDPNSEDIANIKEILNNIVMWLMEVEEQMEKTKKHGLE